MGVVRIIVDGGSYAGVDAAMSARGYLHLIPRGSGDSEVLYALPPGTYWTPEPSDTEELLRDALEAATGETGVRVIVTAGATAWSGLTRMGD